MDAISHIIIGAVFVVTAVGWIVLYVLSALGNDGQIYGPLRGWGPVISGLAVAAVGVLIIIF